MNEGPAAEPVLYEKIGQHVGLVTLNRPEKRNAVNPAMATALEAIVRSTEADTDIRAVILTSSDDRVFCAGADLGAIASGTGKGIETSAGGFAGFVYAQRWKPWIAAVEGMALGGGCELALACEMIVASEAARFGLPEVKRGLLAAAGGVHRIGAVLPRNIANELIATGEPLDAAGALRWGMVNRVTPPGETVATARLLAEAIAANAPLAVQYSLQAARASAAQPDGAGRTIVAERFAALRGTEDFKEGPRAFVEKRAPTWSGR
ncbi:enoyl-CoA hydratase-related protein [Sphingomonas solaris]|uniref:Enoyl-CoA hydratase n=1 Tax=Alterirhizorhabdus solaris TaxID=2529389 RepID=A0A558RBL9_9SPHN|nr:enoyl-CoA hydratase-related protein [Sphingomonas solaris]TVV76751.1 enoyl-CoA hydratase [Sphingomonas solaris]